MANEKIHLISLGCAKNLVNSEQMLCRLVDAGYEETGVAKFALLEPAVELGSLEQIFVLMAFDADSE